MKKIIIFALFFSWGICSNAQCWESANNTGSNLSAAIKTDGTLWVWGTDTPSSGVNTDRPILVGTDTDWKTVSSGWRFRVALKDNGTLWSWGRNYAGSLGQGSTASGFISNPTQIGTDSDWKYIDCSGGAHCLAIKQDGSLWVWGFNHYGALGLGSISNSVSVPTRIGTANDWKTAVVSHIANYGYGDSSSFAIKTDGTLWAWGFNEQGQLGDGTFVTRDTPVQIGSSTDWSNVYDSWHTTLALKTNGTLWATGSNYLGRFGNGTETSSPTFIQIGTDTNWKSLAVGRNHSLGTKTDGSLWAWGDNQYSAFGTGNDTDSLIPVRVGAENDWLSVSVAKGIDARSSQALKSDGTLWAWGGYSASLGIGTIPGGVRSYPAQVSCNSLVNESFSNNIFSVYPNPASEIINIQNSQDITITKTCIYDIAGKKLAEITDNPTQINIGQFEKGMYLIQIFAADGIHQQKIIKQ